MKIVVVGVMLMVSPAQGMIYMWKDSAGIAHFVNKEYDVPDRYKAKAKALYPEAADAATVSPNNAQAQADPTVQPPPIARPEAKPDASSNAPVTQVVTPPKAPERKSRRQRVRRADDE
jgi:hypothetical protein